MENLSTAPEKLFEAYLDICNEALEKNKDSFPYKQLWEAAHRVMHEKAVHVAIYDDTPKATYELKLSDNHIDSCELKENKNIEPWHLTTSYLQKVVEHKDEYINNPAKIDWDWLRSEIS